MRKWKYQICVLAVVIIMGGLWTSVYVYNNIPLRTAIFRTFAKQNIYFITEVDTLYSFGYAGVQKWLVCAPDDMRLLAKNDDFCHNTFVGHLVGRSGVINGDFLYVACRSYLGGPDESDKDGYLNGSLLIMQKSDLSIVKAIPSDIKLIEAKSYDNLMIVSGLKGFDIYNISNPSEIKLDYSYRHKHFTEFQGTEIFEVDTCRYVAFARFADGVSIWNVTNPRAPFIVTDIPIQDNKYNGQYLPRGLQCFRLVLNYPYLYSTLAPMSQTFGHTNDRRGIICYNLSDIGNITTSIILIPEKDYYSTRIGDPEPSHISIYKDKLYTNFGEKGVAVFDITNPAHPQYERIMEISNNDMILPIHINHRGILFAGDYYWNDIYSCKLSN